MSEENKEPKKEKRGFLKKIIETLDKKMEEKAKKTGTCCGGNSKGTSCCN